MTGTAARHRRPQQHQPPILPAREGRHLQVGVPEVAVGEGQQLRRLTLAAGNVSQDLADHPVRRSSARTGAASPPTTARGGATSS